MSERIWPDCEHIPSEGFGCAGRSTPSDIWAGVYPGDCDCDCQPLTPTTTADPERAALAEGSDA